ncbi:MAG: HlyD family efflux transporter periplasmic adaptor subunit [Deltaproteobacteria bacterium]|nr:HlyD family efflux transporter periplasmic adaptor subunit [Deltaproteobacteria bacterium]
MKKRIIAIIFFCLLFGVGLLVYRGQRNLQMKELYYSGTIEAKQAELGFQVSGRIVEVLVNEGEFVKKDQLLASLDQSEYKARYEQTQAGVENSIKNFQRLELVLELYKKTLPDEVARAKAGVEVLRSQLHELEAGYREQDIERAKLAFLTAQDVREEAKKNKERYDNLFKKQLVSESEWDVVKLKHETAVKEFEKAKEKFDMLLEGVRKETIQTARARLAEGKAVLRQAKNNLRKIQMAEKEAEAARSLVKVAQSSLEVVETQLRYTQLRAPFDGVISSRNVELGEVVLPGREVLSLSDLSFVDLKIFVGETEIGRVKPGQLVDIKVDTFPDKIYSGTVSFISPEGEFTPKIIQTQKERVKLVYLVKVFIPNPDFELKSGMPADAWLR